MSWNGCLYQYHKKHGGQFLAGEEDDGLLVLDHRGRILAVDLSMAGAGRGGTVSHVRARIPASLAKPYKLTIGAEKKLSGGLNAVIKAASGVAGYSADLGYPEVTKKRLIRSDNAPFTKLVLGSLDLRNALLACPKDRVEVRPGPGEEGLHLIAVTTDVHTDSPSGDWYLGSRGGYLELYGSEEERAGHAQRVESEFFPRMDRFLDLVKAAYDAVTQWPIPL